MNHKLFFKLNKLAKKSKLLDALIIFLAKYLIFLFVGFLGIIFIFPSLINCPRLTRDRLFFIGAVAALVWFVSLLMKMFHFVPRPQTLPETKALIIKKNRSSAFPSSHTAFLFALGIMLLHYSPCLGIMGITIALLVGMARVISGLHWPIDILEGVVLGWILSLLILLYF